MRVVGIILVVVSFIQFSQIETEVFATGFPTTDGFGIPAPNNPVTAFAVQDDGKILIGGSFLEVSGQKYWGMARLNPDGEIDQSFDIPLVSGFVESIAIQPDGKIIAGGGFSGIVAGPQQRRLARFNADGTFDDTFRPTFDGAVFKVDLMSDGRILAGGQFNEVNGETKRGVVRLNSDGSNDATFGDPGVNGGQGNGNHIIWDVEHLSDDKVLIGGDFTHIGKTERRAFARLNADGSLDQTFTDPMLEGGGGTALQVGVEITVVTSIMVQADNKIIIGGSMASVGGTPRGNLARLNPNGSLDKTFADPNVSGIQFNSFIRAAALQPDGKIVIGGLFEVVGNLMRRKVGRVNPDGTADPTWVDTVVQDGRVFEIALQPDGKVLIGGFFSEVSTRNRRNMTRLKPDGSLDVPAPRTLVVTKLEDSNDGVCDRDCSLREAVHAANTVASDETITFEGSHSLDGGSFDLTEGVLTICNEGRVTIKGVTDSKTIIDGGGNSQVLRVKREATAVLEDLVIRGGNGGNQFPDSLPPSCLDSGISTSGGGLENEGTMYISRSSIVDNISPSGLGGGISNINALLVIKDSFIQRNLARSGGGIFNRGENLPGEAVLIITDSVVSDNEATRVTSEGGGGITNQFSARLDVNRSSIVRNVAARNGGGIYSEDSDFTITNSTISFNSAQRGGAIGFEQGGMASIQNATIAFNNASVRGGGIENTLPFCADFSAKNTIVGQNESPDAPDYAGRLVSQGYNLIGNSQGLTVCGITTGNKLNVAAQLEPELRSTTNGTLYHLPDISSPALDSGALIQGLDHDQRFVGRPIDLDGIPDAPGGNASDIGSVERRSIESENSAPFDFDGDGATDVSVFRPNSQPTAQWWLLRSSDSGTRGLAFGSSTDVPVAADFTGDGKTDVAFWRPSTGEWFILRSEDDSFFAFPFGSNGDIPAPGDFDGDGKADPAVYRPSSGTWFIVRSSDGGLSVVPFGVAADKPIVADCDGDGKDDVGVYRAPDNQFWLLRSTDGVKAFQFGAPGDRTAVGDWTGDGKADVAFFRPSTSEWYVIRSEDDSFFAFPWGATGDVPSPGDFDGDGKFDPAVWRPSDRTWYIFGTTSGFEAVQFGSPGDVPLPSSVSVN